MGGGRGGAGWGGGGRGGLQATRKCAVGQGLRTAAILQHADNINLAT